MAFFGTFDYGEDFFGVGDGGTTPYDPSHARVPWVFQEANGVDVYEFAINPLDVTVPSHRKTFSKDKTTLGQPIIFEGRGVAPAMSFSGTILTEVHLKEMHRWVLKESQVSIRDDLGRQYWVYLTSFSPTRRYHFSYPWRHEFQCSASVLDWG